MMCHNFWVTRLIRYRRGRSPHPHKPRSLTTGLHLLPSLMKPLVTCHLPCPPSTGSVTLNDPEFLCLRRVWTMASRQPLRIIVRTYLHCTCNITRFFNQWWMIYGRAVACITLCFSLLRFWQSLALLVQSGVMSISQFVVVVVRYKVLWWKKASNILSILESKVHLHSQANSSGTCAKMYVSGR
jgi:hypothetical protein